MMDPTVLRAVLAPYGRAADFKGLAKAAWCYAKLCLPDEGTRPRSRAFDTLCVRLIDGFKRVTKRKPTSSGDYFRLIEAVWGVACEIAETVTKRSVEPNLPTSGALRKRVERLLKHLGPDGLERLRRDP